MSGLSGVLQTSIELQGEYRKVFTLESSDGHFLGATLHAPALIGSGDGDDLSSRAATRYSILLLPGWSGPRSGPAELLVWLSRDWALRGHTVLRIDFHGRGDSSGVFLDGDLDRMIVEASLGMDYLIGLDPNRPIAVGGICSGANVALGLTALRAEEVDVALAFSILPYQTSRGADLERKRRWKNIKQYAAKALRPATWGKLIRGEVNMDRVHANVSGSEKPAEGERNRKDSARDIERELLAWRGRGLFVWGSGDEEAGLARKHFEHLHAQGCCGAPGEARFATIQGANHNFYRQAWRTELQQLAGAFLSA